MEHDSCIFPYGLDIFASPSDCVRSNVHLVKLFSLLLIITSASPSVDQQACREVVEVCLSLAPFCLKMPPPHYRLS